MTSTSSGLGRGLAAILTGPSMPSHDASLRSKFIESALSSLSAPAGLALCGYVHDDSRDPSVTLRSPELSSLHPTQAYQLFTALGAVSSKADGRHEVTFADLSARGVTMTGTNARGLIFFGDTNLDDASVDRLAAFCEVYLPVILEHDRPADDTERLHLVLDQEGATVHAEVSIGSHQGFGSAPNTHVAAAQAALSAYCQDAKLVDVGMVRASEGAASFVVATGDMGRLAMGAAPVVGGPDAAAALAAVRAVRYLDCSCATNS